MKLTRRGLLKRLISAPVAAACGVVGVSTVPQRKFTDGLCLIGLPPGYHHMTATELAIQIRNEEARQSGRVLVARCKKNPNGWFVVDERRYAT